MMRVMRRHVVVDVGPGDKFSLGPWPFDVTLRASALTGSITINLES